MPTSDAPLVLFVSLPHRGENVEPPRYQTVGSAGADLTAAINAPQRIPHGMTVVVPTGLILEIPHGYEGQIRSRSGLALKDGIIVLNAPATIDSDYRGEIKVLLINLGPTEVTIEPGQRIAQLVIAPYLRADFRQITQVSDTGRGTGGFGSTGR